MDLFVWLCGCILALLLPSAVKAGEGGKFDAVAVRLNPSVTQGVKRENRSSYTSQNEQKLFSFSAVKVNSGKASLRIW